MDHWECIKRAYPADQIEAAVERLKKQEPGFAWWHYRCLNCGEFHIMRGKLEKIQHATFPHK